MAKLQSVKDPLERAAYSGRGILCCPIQCIFCFAQRILLILFSPVSSCATVYYSIPLPSLTLGRLWGRLYTGHFGPTAADAQNGCRRTERSAKRLLTLLD